MLKLPQHKLIQECVTRWGSTLHMLQRLMEQQAAIAAVLMEGNMRHLMPESAEWTVIEELAEILEPFQQATEAMSGVKYPTVSTIKPLLYKLLEKTLKASETDSTTVKEAIKGDLQGRFQSPAIQKIVNVATYLDPRYKELHVPFLDERNKQRIVDDVRDELLELDTTEPTDQEEPPSTDSEVSEQPPAKKRKEGPVSKLLGDLFQYQGQNQLHSDYQRRWKYTRLRSQLSLTQIP